jgi:hypothetical protein
MTSAPIAAAGFGPGGGADARQPADRHYQAMLCAEVLRLARELRAVGPLPRATLPRRRHTGRARGRAFDAAVRAGVRRGTLRQRPFDFIDVRG